MPGAARVAPSADHHPLTLEPRPSPRTVADPSYVCPMCPEVRESKPGACPSCGMALEPEVPRCRFAHRVHLPDASRDRAACTRFVSDLRHDPRAPHRHRSSEDNPELRDMTRRFWVSVALTAPLIAVAMGSMLGYKLTVDLDINGVLINVPRLEFALATPVVLWGGWPFFQRFWTSLINRSPNMFTLIGMGTGVAYGYSVVATLVPQIFPRLCAAWVDILTFTSKPRPQSPLWFC